MTRNSERSRSQPNVLSGHKIRLLIEWVSMQPAIEALLQADGTHLAANAITLLISLSPVSGCVACRSGCSPSMLHLADHPAWSVQFRLGLDPAASASRRSA
jgi:hypothetical protein